MKADQRTRCEVYSRVVGYLRPVDQWNEGKQAEFAERTTYSIGPSGKESQAETAEAACKVECGCG